MGHIMPPEIQRHIPFNIHNPSEPTGHTLPYQLNSRLYTRLVPDMPIIRPMSPEMPHILLLLRIRNLSLDLSRREVRHLVPGLSYRMFIHRLR